MTCPGLNSCTKKSCVEQERCINIASVPSYWSKKGKLMNKGEKVDCRVNQSLCNKKRVCKILGQCILLHPDIKGNKQHENHLRKQLTMKEVVKYLEKIRPGLKRIGDRKYYRPDARFTREVAMPLFDNLEKGKR